MKISEIKENPENPRFITDEKFKKLKESIKNFPEMLKLRPLVIDADNVVLGGNMRLKACKELGFKDVPVLKADELTEEQKREFIIKDNVGFGQWEWETLTNEWDNELLEDWGLEIVGFDNDLEDETDYSNKNKELDLSDFEDEKQTIKLEFTEDDYTLVKEKLQQLGQSHEKILYDALVSL